MKHKIIVESHIPYIRGVFEPVARVEYLAPEEIDARAVEDADALVVRTRTRCDAGLLDGSRCRVVATATIGTDHIDIPYCQRSGIKVVNAPGCNAPAVAQYVFASIAGLRREGTLGVVGVGHVGRIVEAWGRALGFRVLLCDPPRQAVEGDEGFSSLEKLIEEADVLTFHTPLVKSGPWPTYHLADGEFFTRLKRCPVIVNAARGPVVDNSVLLDALNRGLVSDAVVDCWEGEPELSLPLLDAVAVGTPHIAGYSIEGKRRATVAAVKAVAGVLGLNLSLAGVPAPEMGETGISWEAITASYDPAADTRALRADASGFEKLRNSYALRHEVGYSSSNIE